jgi:hypothetical protein
MLITGFVDILAYGFHNSGDLNKNREMNLGITASQLSFGIIICLISILLVWWHCTTNTISYVEKIQKLLGDEGLEYSTLGQFKTSISDKGMKLKPYISWFAIILLILAFLYGVTIVIFSADRLLCTTTGSCSITKFTAEEKAALRV